MTTEKLISELTYRSYREQRLKYPTITPLRWARIYGIHETDLMEQRFTAELKEKSKGAA